METWCLAEENKTVILSSQMGKTMVRNWWVYAVKYAVFWMKTEQKTEFKTLNRYQQV